MVNKYLFQVMTQRGARLPYDLDVSQILEDNPNQVNQANENPKGHNGGNRREHLLLESPSYLFQKPKVPNTHAHRNLSIKFHEQPYGCPLSWRRNSNAHAHQQDNT